MKNFEYHAPRSLDEAHSLLDEHGEEAQIIAGGTALLLFMKQRLAQPEHLLTLQEVPGLDGITVSEDAVHLGAMCTHRQVETSPVLQDRVPLLCETYRCVATPRIRNMATVGGGLVHADPNLDPPPSLMALGALVVLASSSGERTVPVEEFFLDYYETAIQAGEVITEGIVPAAPARTGGAFLKFLPRTCDDYATVSAAALVTLREDGATCQEVRIGLGAVGVTPIRAKGAEAVLRGRTLTSDLVRQAAQAVESEVDPMDDFRGSAGYKRKMVQVFVRRAVDRALERVGEVSQ